MELLPWALAAGFGVALAIAPWFGLLALGLATFLPFLPPLPGDLEAFGSPWIATPTLALALTGLLLGGRPSARAFWELLHTPVRLVLPCLVLLLALEPAGAATDLSRPLALGGPLLLSLALSTLLVLLRWGRSVVAGLRDRPSFHERWDGALALELMGAFLTVATVTVPAVGGLLAGLVAMSALIRGRPELRVGPLIPHLLQGAARSLGGGEGWRDPPALPRWVKHESPQGDAGNSLAVLRGTPAVLLLRQGDGKSGPEGPAEGGELRAGWLVIQGGLPRFLFRSPARIWELNLGNALLAGDVGGESLLIQRVELRDGEDRMILGTSRGGPNLEEIQAEFTRNL